jgi:hypothetical protein
VEKAEVPVAEPVPNFSKLRKPMLTVCLSTATLEK